MTSGERLDRLEESHVKLMTEHEVFWAENRRSWEEHREFLRQYDARCERDRDDRVQLDKRIEQFVSGIGEFIRKGGK